MNYLLLIIVAKYAKLLDQACSSKNVLAITCRKIEKYLGITINFTKVIIHY